MTGYFPGLTNISTSITNAFNNGYQKAVAFKNHTYQVCKEGVTAVYEYRKDPDLFQKTCQVGWATLLAVNAYRGGKALSRVSASLWHAANMQNFEGFLKIPYNTIYTIRANTIDEWQLKASLKGIIQTNFQLDELDAEGLAKAIVRVRLLEMSNGDDLNHYAFSNSADFIHAFHARLRDAKFKDEVEKIYPGHQAVLTGLGNQLALNLNIKLKHESLLNKISRISFVFVDIGCVPMYLQEWGIFVSHSVSNAAHMADLGKYADAIGQSKVGQWVSKQNIEEWVIAGCCLAFGAKLLESVRVLRDQKLTESQKKAVQWDIVASATELVFCYTLAIQAREVTIIAWTLIAKTTGIFSIMNKNKLAPEFFVRA